MKIGIDEVGRGCLAGELVVVAYAFDPLLSKNDLIKIKSLCRDSKSFSSQKSREKVFDEIEAGGVYSLSRRTPHDIEMLNIRQAVLSAMKESSENVAQILYNQHGMPVECIFDGRDCPENLILPNGSTYDFLIKGDSKLEEIGAASIIAKVIRDREMVDLSAVYPGYGFERNAGYGTKLHRDAIHTLGMTPIHRTWSKKFL
jgi:ribonuclease HII